MDFIPPAVRIVSLRQERDGYVQQLPRRPELQARIDAVDAEIARTEKLAKTSKAS